MFSLGRMKMALLEEGTLGITGKAPGHAEFLNAPTTREPLASFDAWLDEGIATAYARFGTSWDAAFDLGEAYGFVWAPEGCEIVLVGVVAPSRDSVGRRHPVAVFAALERGALRSAAHAIPIGFGDFFESAYEAVRDAAAGAALGRLRESVARLKPPSIEALHRAATEYAAWCRTTPLTHAWDAVFAPPASTDAALRALGALRAGAERSGSVAAPAHGTLVRAPLGSGGPAAAAFWLDVLGRQLRWGGEVPTALWAAERAPLHAVLGAPDANVLVSLWRPETPLSACDLTSLPSSREAGTERRLPRDLLQLLGRSDAVVSDLLEALKAS